MSATTTREAIDSAMIAITAAGSQTPRLDAELLLAHVLGVPRARLFIDSELTVAGDAVRAFQQAVKRRSVAREPVAYILGSKSFRHIDLTVDGRALIPRPETELLVEVGLELAPGTRVLDLCTGSGAVALALKDERGDLKITGSDISPDALALARANSQRLALDVHFLEADLLEGIEDQFDAVLANPPYVQSSAYAHLMPEITRHEPALALLAGADGLCVINRLLDQLASRASVKTLALEVGAGQARDVGERMRVLGFHQVNSRRDLAGIERVVVGRR